MLANFGIFQKLSEDVEGLPRGRRPFHPLQIRTVENLRARADV
jgi:hypothetical protein